ncbi:MAG: GH36-type glycosyl hydrolase domain-containing protein [Bacillota bacterium]
MATVIPPAERGFFKRLRDDAAERRVGPFRGQLLGVEGLAAHARALGLRQRSVPGERPIRRWLRPLDAGPLLGRLDDTERLLEETRDALTAAVDRGTDISSAGDWLLDNFYVVQEHIREIRLHLPRGYYAELPKLAEGPLAGYPRIYELAIELIAHTEGHLDIENIGLFVREFQTGAVLNMGELWAVPTVLRLGLVENIRRLAVRVMQRLSELESADEWARQLEEASRTSPKALTDTLGRFVDDHPPLTPIFVARLFQQIRGYQAEFRKLLWLEQWIAEEALTAEDAVTRSNQRLALTQVMMANHLTSLRRISRLDWDVFFESQSLTEATLREDPSAHYAAMTFETRDHYRHVVENVARGARAEEEDVARRAIALAEARRDAGAAVRETHVGFFLIDSGRIELERAVGYRPDWRERLFRLMSSHPGSSYFGGMLLLSLLLLAALFALVHPATPAAQALLLLLALVPVSEVAVATVNQLLTVVLPPARLPKLDFRERGVPDEMRTVVVVPTLLPSVEVVREQLEHLEVQFLANRERNIHFALLGDFADAAHEHEPDDDAILAAAVEGIQALNRAYGEGGHCAFHLLHRSRQWNPRQGVWMGWERKRGKLGQFNAFLLGGPIAPFTTVAGDAERLRGASCVLTLDSDTTLPRDAADLMVGALAHPLNRAQFDPALGRVVRGYAILQPRVGVALTSAYRTRFAAVHSGHPGVDPYTTAVSDVYQDLYGEGSYTGKGIYDVAAFERATEGRFPENALLSHDLIEGAFAGAALMTDVQLFDDYPATYLTHARRKHRWIRGDWQLLPWLRARVPARDGLAPNPLSTISRWKILDNLRRSLVEIFQVALFVAGCTVLPGSPLVWTGIVLLAVAWPWLLSTLLAVIRPPRDGSWRGYYKAVARDAGASADQFILAVVFLAHQAALSADAISRTLYRMLVSRRHLLEWHAASQVERSSRPLQRIAWRRLGPSVVVAAVITGLAAWAGTLPAALPLTLCWMAAPAVAHALSRPPIERSLRLGAADRLRSLRYALLHWRYFETFVTDETHGLAPDNFQETPEPVVAGRTSPTNIGLHLLSIVTARDLGFVTTEGMIRRLEGVFRSLERMRRCCGHFYNWYDLSDLSVLEPAYVSTVDSGNLAGHLLALKQACLAPAPQPAFLEEVLHAAAALAVASEPGAEAARELKAAADAATVATIRPHLQAALGAAEADPATSADALWWMRWAVARAKEAPDNDPAGAPSPTAAEEAARLAVLARRAHEYAVAMDFKLLFDRQRKLFSIGYVDAVGVLDNSYYDLLASEARLASFFAIAKDDVPPEHWFRLGRSLTIEGGATALVSWSGSMFEYLMPVLVMRSPPFTLLHQTHRGAVERQIAYGRENAAPWGMSESAYNVRDRHGTYQYRAFGVPNLALKRGLSKELVVAPYASLLALHVDPAAAMSNLITVEREGALGPYGFRDAIDFTRPAPDARSAVVGTFMAHHIGMGLVSLGNALTDRIWQTRFHGDPLIRSAEVLLSERIPRRFVSQEPQTDTGVETRDRGERELPAVREYTTPDTARPRVALLGALPYTVLLTNSGAGSSRYDYHAVTRWRSDSTRDHYGQWCYIKDLTDGRVWSAAHQPVCRPADRYRAAFASDRVSFQRRDGEIETQMEIAVVPDDRAEVRRVTITNHAWTERTLELTSYGEIVLAPQDADRAHPAFGNLFVQTEWVAAQTAILASRRPRSANETRLWCAHVVAAERGGPDAVSWETDRAAFIGRGRTTANPVAMDDGAELSGATGPVLDPIFAIRVRITVPAGKSARVAFTTLVQPERDRAIELADRYNDLYGAQRAFDLSWTRSQMELQDIGVSPAESALYQQLAGHLIYPHPALRATEEELERNTRSQEALWTHGISGDLPILLAMIDSAEGLPTVRQLLSAHYYWRLHGLGVDLVILNTMPATYLQDLNDQIQAAVRGSTEGAQIDQHGGVFIRRQDLLSPEDVALLRAVARVHIVCDSAGLEVLRDLPDAPVEYPGPLVAHPLAVAARKVKQALAPNAPAPPAPAPLALFNGLGGLTPALDYEMRLDGAHLPPAPWVNVIANAAAGFVVTECGGGFSWVGNSHFYRLTPWHNDPVSDTPGDVVYLRDEETGDVWTVTPGPVRHAGPYVVRHEAGASVFSHEHTEIAATLTVGMATEDPVRIARLELINRGASARRISVTSYVEWTLGVFRERTEHDIRTRFDRGTGAILAQNFFDKLFADQVAFSWMSGTLASHTGDRREFLGRNRGPANPEGLTRQRLAGRTGAGLDPCAALQRIIPLAPGARVEVVILLGAARGDDEARVLIERYRPDVAAAGALEAAEAAWARRLSTITVRTPSPEFDAIVNRAVLYQALACRMWARSALYQSSGAYGFRDQLQDGMAFVHAEPGVTRAHIVESAGRQFVEGDVQHWWHPQSGRGIRTRFSDDLAWLPYCVEQYVRVTGDGSVLDEKAPFLRMRLLAEGEDEIYDLPQESGETGTVYEHCLRALRKAATHGPHGLPLIGSGDWNDGLNRVGIEGRGESVWLAWFLTDTLRRFAAIADARGDTATAAEFRATADGYVTAAERDAWDGAWYRRAYFDDGTPLGSAQSEECRIDSIAQSWSVIARAGSAERTAQAMESLGHHLVRDDARLIMLLTPPFDRMPHDPGYIKGYVPGVRENGAQYTHAALWAVLATAMRGDGNRAFELFQMLNPLTHARTPEEVARYRVEPYVVAADVYTAEGHVGRGGWTWYTGSASWMYRVALEAILGFERAGAQLTFDPVIPREWDGFELDYRFGNTVYAIRVRNAAHVNRGVMRVTVDGQAAEGGRIELVDDGKQRTIEVEMGGPASS